MSKPKEYSVEGKNYFAWKYEEQTKIKHQGLCAYSKVWISKLGCLKNTLFFDCHGGCGAYLDADNVVKFGSSVIVRHIADTVNKNRQTKTAIVYCEKEKKNYENFLKVIDDCGKMKIKHYNDEFQNVMANPTIIKYFNTYPSLFFVDPFGYNFDINVLANLMQSFGNELIINFMFDFINRFIADPKIEKACNTFFGCSDWKKADKLCSQEREEFLVNLFKNQLRKTTGAKYIFAYRLCYPDKNQTYYYLIHATNHIDGITFMKQAFASVSNGRVQYLGKNNNTFTFFDLDGVKAEDIYSNCLLRFKGKKMTFNELWENIVDDCAYTAKDLSNALISLEKDRRVVLKRVSSKRCSYKEKDLIEIL